MKLKLDELKIQSFVTSLESSEKLTVQGGTDSPAACYSYFGCSPTWPANSYQIPDPLSGYQCSPGSCGVGDDPPQTEDCHTNDCVYQSGFPSGCTDPGTGYTCFIQGC